MTDVTRPDRPVGSTPPVRVAVLGASGFIGQAVVNELRGAGHDVVELPRVRVDGPGWPDVVSAVPRWIEHNQAAYELLVRQMEGARVVVNAAGMAVPESRDVARLTAANAVLPGVLAHAASEAGVPRLVHVSSAAAQGTRDPLDESPTTAPITPYGESKAQGEHVLLDGAFKTPPEVVVYRPTSVQGAGRRMTRQLTRLARMPLVPLFAGGDCHVPVALSQNVAAAIRFLCTAPSPPGICLHPWEGMTARGLLEALGATRFVPVPAWCSRAALSTLYLTGRGWPGAAAVARRLDVLARGQGQDARHLDSLGFRLPVGVEGYQALGGLPRSGQ